MPDNSISIRVAGTDDGVSALMRKIAAEAKASMDSIRSMPDIAGPAVKPRFDFREQLVRDEMARLLKKLRADADREKIRIEAQLVVKQARENLFGPDGAAPLRDISGRGALEQAARDRQAQDLRDERARASAARDANASYSDEDFAREARQRFRGTERPGGGGGGQNIDAAGANVAIGQLKQFFQARQILRVAEIIASIPKVVESYKESMKVGENAFAALGKAIGDNVPFLGEFVKAGIAIRQTIHDLRHPSEVAKEDHDAEQQRLREVRQKLRDEREAKRKPIIEEANRAGVDARDSLSLAGKTGYERETAEANLEYQKKLREAAALEAKKSILSPDEAKKLENEAGQVRAAALAQYNDKVDEIGDKYSHQREDSEREHQKSMADIIRQGNVERLREEGKEQAARIEEINNDHDRKAEDLKDRLARELKDLKGAPKQIQDEARKRAADEQKALDDEQKRRVAGVTDPNSRQNREARLAIDDQLTQHRIALLHDEGEAGDRSAQIEAQKLEVAEKYRKEREAIAKIIQDEHATAAQRQDALKTLQGLGPAEREALKRISPGKVDNSPAALVETRFGAGFRAREVTNPVLDATRDNGGKLDTIKDTLAGLPDALGKILGPLVAQLSTGSTSVYTPGQT